MLAQPGRLFRRAGEAAAPVPAPLPSPLLEAAV
jgi:hypothetical protein